VIWQIPSLWAQSVLDLPLLSCPASTHGINDQNKSRLLASELIAAFNARLAASGHPPMASIER
jgi:hypothetical protein